MAYKLEQRKIEILKSLRRNRSGLTTAKLVADCVKQPGAETPDDNSVASRNLFQLRGAKLITSFDVSGGKIHALTAAGLTAINEIEPEEDAVEIEQVNTKIDNDMAEANAIIDHEHKSNVVNNQEVITLTQGVVLNPDEPVEAAFIEILQSIRDAQNRPVITIDRYDDKVNSLRILGNMLSDDFKVVLYDIAGDLKRITEAQQ